jgi:hypothetical protein
MESVEIDLEDEGVFEKMMAAKPPAEEKKKKKEAKFYRINSRAMFFTWGSLLPDQKREI